MKDTPFNVLTVLYRDSENRFNFSTVFKNGLLELTRTLIRV